eukprot:SM000024S07848  [mRNA]  locus=s24:814083:814594:- [translate_table: standard]
MTVRRRQPQAGEAPLLRRGPRPAGSKRNPAPMRWQCCTLPVKTPAQREQASRKLGLVRRRTPFCSAVVDSDAVTHFRVTAAMTAKTSQSFLVALRQSKGQSYRLSITRC